MQTWLHVQIAFPARIRQSIKAAWEAGEDLDRKLGMYLKQKQVLSKQSASATKLWLISVSCLLVVVMVLNLQHWKRRKHVNHVKPLITPAPLLSQPEPIEPQFMPPPRRGFRGSDRIYETTNLGNWFEDLKSTNPATVQRAREALAALGVETSPSTNVSAGVELTNTPPPVPKP